MSMYLCINYTAYVYTNHYFTEREIMEFEIIWRFDDAWSTKVIRHCVISSSDYDVIIGLEIHIEYC